MGKTKYGASDPDTIVQRKQRIQSLLRGAIMRRDRGSAFPIGDLRDCLDEIMPQIDRFAGRHWIGNLTYDSKGKVNWSLDTITPIRDFSIHCKRW
jgi:hypothetical protein